MNTKALKKLNYSLTLASTAAEGKNFGCIVNSLHQVTSSSPQKFSLSLHNDSATCAAIKKSSVLAVTLLGKDCPKEIVNEFGYKSGRAVDKFASFPFETDAQGCPFLKKDMVARLAFKVLEQVAVGTHTLFICELADAELLDEGDCLTVKEYETRGADVPPAAPVYHELDANAGWKCTVCGYVRLSDEIPDDYICPICRAPRSKFVKR
ncbi:flavin reductase family protein [Agathobaculum sp.]|uniref:flavin reductase family protein n=1 Tax=Agathobaculum sp. TaxID=2048138 RepID=UPI002A7F9F37|nr:flavin reductase [Agathobaculum sp.]MDY3618668.1 flavin reductase [Agathobaculum sp.]